MRTSQCSAILLTFVLLAASRSAAEEKGEAPNPFCRIFDTGAHSSEALSNDAVAKRTGWQQVPEDNLTHKFTGDAVLANDKLVAVIRGTGGSIDVYATTASGSKHRALLGHAGAYSAFLDPIESLKIVENAPGAVVLEVAFKTGPQATLRLRLTTGEGILEIRPGEGAQSVLACTKSFCVLVPDFFADDMIFVPEKFNGTLLPAENFFLGLIEGGDAMMMAVWQSGKQDVTLGITSVGKDTKLCSTRVTCATGKGLWLAFLEQPGIWATNAVKPPPFPAHWRTTWGTAAPFAMSWDVDKRPPSPFGGRRDGPFVVYPIDRSKATPLTIYTPMDVLRNTLGVGPCQYILQSEGLASETNPTPDNVMDWAEKQFKRGKEKQASDKIKERLKQMTEHMGKERSRIEKYSFAAFETLELCSGKWPRPLLPVADGLVMKLDYLKRFPMTDLEAVGPAARPPELASQVAALIGKENALADCERLGAELRGIGKRLDRTLSECRMRTRWLRQQCRMAAAKEPQSAELAKMIQESAERMLQGK